MILRPVLALHFENGRHGKRVDGAFGHGKETAVRVSGGQAEAVLLVAPLHVQLEAVTDSPQTGKPGDARPGRTPRIHSYDGGGFRKKSLRICTGR